MPSRMSRFAAESRLDKTYDLENIIISKDPQALEWGRLLFLYFQSSAEKIDLNTFQGKEAGPEPPILHSGRASQASPTRWLVLLADKAK
jgi:hypothetical protein